MTEKITVYFTNWEYWFDLGTTQWHDDAKVIDYNPCIHEALKYIDSDSKEVRNNTAKMISKILNTK